MRTTIPFLAILAAPLALPGVTLVHYYDFEGGYSDLAGASNGTAGAEVTSATGFDGGTAANFPSTLSGGGAFSSAGYVDISPAISGVTGAFAFSYWLSLSVDTTTNPRGIFDFSGDGGDGPQSLFIQTGGNAGNMAFRIDGAGSTNAVTFATVPEDGSWFSVAANFTPGGSLDLYIDGTLASSVSAAGVTSVVWDADQYIGAFNVNATAAARGVAGSLDDFAIYSGTLTTDEIAGLADRSLSPDNLVIPEPSTGLLSLLAAGLLLRRRCK